MEPQRWTGDVGLFVGFGPSPANPDSDRAILIDVAQRPTGKLFVERRIMTQQRGGLQHPQMFQQLDPSEKEIPAAGQQPGRGAVGREGGRLVAVYLNQSLMAFPVPDPLSDVPATGSFGVFVFGGSSTFSNAAIRVSTMRGFHD